MNSKASKRHIGKNDAPRSVSNKSSGGLVSGMTNSASSTDKIFVNEHYAIHYRRATAARAQWAGGEAHPAYAALFVLDGAMRWQAGDGRSGELRASGLLVAAPGESVRARGGKVETLALSVAPASCSTARARTSPRDDRASLFPRGHRARPAPARLAPTLLTNARRRDPPRTHRRRLGRPI